MAFVAGCSRRSCSDGAEVTLPNTSKRQHGRSASHKARTPNRVRWNNRRKRPESAPGVMQISPRRGFCGPQVENYRSAHEIALRVGKDAATTEDLRTAMIHYRSLFEELVQAPTAVERK